MTKIFTTLFVMIFFAFVGAVPAQFSKVAPTADNPKPFDFTKDFYYNNGVEQGSVMDRRTGTDKFSVFDKSWEPNRSDIRVLVTVAAYSQKGTMLYWNPLGELNDNAFRNDKIGYYARKIASLYPIYVFPVARQWDYFKFGTGRQAAVIDESRAALSPINNPLGLRQIVIVNYTSKAFEPEYQWLMKYYASKNGFTSEDTPILNTVEDIMFMFNKGLVTTDTIPFNVINPHGQYMVAPIIYDPTRGAIAKDAFIWMAMKDGKCLPTEEIFEDNFDCLKEGKWCILPSDH